jgi:hypothetical protein
VKPGCPCGGGPSRNPHSGATLGGADQLSAIERALIEGFAGATITLQGINYKIALGQVIEVTDLAQAISAMVRVASRLGSSSVSSW